MKSFPLMQGKNLAGLGVTLTPALAFASEAAFNPLEWAGGILVIGLVVVSVGFIAEASGEALDAGLKAVGYQRNLRVKKSSSEKRPCAKKVPKLKLPNMLLQCLL